MKTFRQSVFAVALTSWLLAMTITLQTNCRANPPASRPEVADVVSSVGDLCGWVLETTGVTCEQVVKRLLSMLWESLNGPDDDECSNGRRSDSGGDRDAGSALRGPPGASRLPNGAARAPENHGIDVEGRRRLERVGNTARPEGLDFRRRSESLLTAQAINLVVVVRELRLRPPPPPAAKGAGVAVGERALMRHAVRSRGHLFEPIARIASSTSLMSCFRSQSESGPMASPNCRPRSNPLT